MGVEPPLPDVSGNYVVDAFLRMKIATSSEVGLQPRSWQEVLSFSEATGCMAMPWERQLLFDMSWDYVQEHSKASSPFLKSPMERTQNG